MDLQWRPSLKHNLPMSVCATLCIAVFLSGGVAAQNDQTVEVAQNFSSLLSELNAAGISSNKQLLMCYECREYYKNNYDPRQSPCRNNVSQVSLRLCGPEHTYCKVEREDYSGFGITLSIERGCADTGKCLYGCKFNNYGVTHMKCTSCCRTSGCNTDNGAPSWHPPRLLLLLALLPVMSLDFRSA